MPLHDLSLLGLNRYGDNVRIYDSARLQDPAGIEFCDNIIIDDFVFLQAGRGLTIGSYVHIATLASVTGGGQCSIGHFATIASGARIMTGTDITDGSGLTNSTIPSELRSVLRGSTAVDRFAFVGLNSVVHPNVHVGEGSVIGSQSLALDDVEPWTINVGSPCRPIKRRPSKLILEYARRLGFEE